MSIAFSAPFLARRKDANPDRLHLENHKACGSQMRRGRWAMIQKRIMSRSNAAQDERCDHEI